MSSKRRKGGEPCAHENCGSRRFYVGDDGYTYCDQGHQQRERGTVIAEETGEFVQYGRKQRRKASDDESTTSRASAFTGADALEQYLLCLQLVLRKQLRWLIDVQQLPEELEALVKDLWALRLQKLRSKITYESETDTEAPSSQQLFSSQSESESQSQSASRSPRRSREAKVQPKEGTPTMSEILALCNIGTLLLRMPLTVADFYRWTRDGKLLFYRASHEIPFEMRERLPPSYKHLLEPQELLRAELYQQNVLDMFTRFHTEVGMEPPRVNVPLICYRWMKELVLPVAVFAGTQRLGKALEVDIKFDIMRTNTRVVFRYPEAQLMALLVVATKLLFPMEVKHFRTPTSNDLSAVFFHWDEWDKFHRNRDARAQQITPLAFGKAFEYTEADCLAAGDGELDAYLDWCERNMASEEIRERGKAAQSAVFRRALFDIFPVQTRDEGANANPSDRAVPTDNLDSAAEPADRVKLHARPVGEGHAEDFPVVGSHYRRFRSVDELSGPAKVLYDKAAQLACVSIESMVHAVFWTERKVQVLEERLRKNEVASGMD